MPSNELNSEDNDFGFNLFEVARIFHRQRNLVYSFGLLVLILGFSSSLIERKFKPLYGGYFTLLVEDPFVKSEEKKSDNFIEDIASYNTSNDLPTIIEVLKSKELLKNVLQKYDLNHQLFLQSLVITKGGNTKNIREEANGILKVTFFGPNKDLVLKILEDISKEYISYSLKQRKDRIKEGLEFLNSQNPDIKERMSLIQNDIEKLRSQNLFINPTNDVENLDQLRIKYDKNKSFLETQLEEFLRVKKEINNDNLIARSFKDTIITSEGKVNAEEFGLSLSIANQSLLTEIEILKSRLANLKTIYTSDADVIKSLEKKIDNLTPKAKEAQLLAVETAISSTNLKIAEVEKKKKEILKKYKNRLSLINKFDLLREELEIAKQNYAAFTQTKEKYRLSIAQNNFPWEIINFPSVRKNPIKPNLINRLILYTFISIISALFVALLKDRLDNFFHSPKEVKESLNLKILSEIPFLKNPNHKKSYSFLNNFLKIDDQKISKKDILEKSELKRNLYFYNEAFKFLVSSISLEKEKRNFKVINITSAIQGEGKTQTCIELSKTLHSMGKKILLIDGDLRRPQLHKKFKVDNKIGLSDLNKFSEDKFQVLIKNSRDFRNIDLITSGKPLKDPFTIFNSIQYENFLIWLKDLEQYEYIIFDSPQSLFLAESNLLCKSVDFTLIVISLFKVDKDLVRETINNINIASGNILGAITVSNRDGDSFGYNYNNYGYGFYNNYFLSSEQKIKSNSKYNNILDLVSKWLKKLF